MGAMRTEQTIKMMIHWKKNAFEAFTNIFVGTEKRNIIYCFGNGRKNGTKRWATKTKVHQTLNV